MSERRVRRVQPHEGAEVRRVRLAALLESPDAFAARHEHEAARPDAHWERLARDGARSDHVATFVAVDVDGRHLGTATGVLSDREAMVWLVAMWVDPAARGAGLGRELVGAVCEWARGRRAMTVELDVREQNRAALALYRATGFEVAAGPYPAPAAPHLNELRMRRLLAAGEDGPVVRRLRRLHADDLVDAVERLPTADLRSLMLHAARRRSAARTPASLLHDRRAQPTLAPVPVDGRMLHEVERLALDAAGGFEPVTLSPIAPGGVNTVLAGLDQNLALATVRGSEVVADPTTSLALEVALRRRGGDPAPALCAVGRVIRMQQFDEGWNQHFGLFALASGGRVAASHGFSLSALREHLRVYLRLLAALRADGHELGRATVEISDSALVSSLCREAGVDLDAVAARARAGEAEPEQLLAQAGIELPRYTRDVPVPGPRGGRLALVRREVLDPLAGEFPEAELGFRPGRLAAIGYYRGLLLNIDVDVAGGRLSVADGGTVDWTQRLLSDRKERLLVSGIGVERLAVLAGRATPSAPLP